MKTIIRLVLFLGLGIMFSGCKTIVNKLAFQPDSINVLQQVDLPSGIKELTVITEDNISLKSLYLPVAQSKKIIIYFHGNAGNIYHRIPSLLQLQKMNINVIGVSYRGYGKSQGTPNEDGLYQDGKAILKFVNEELGFTDKNTVIFGRSIGTTVAINTAQEKNIAGLILVTPLTSGKAYAKSSGLNFISFLAGDSFNNLAKIKNINTPLLVVHGTKDAIIPYSMGEEIFDAARSRKKLIKIDGGGHNNLQDRYEQQYWPPIADFIKNLH